MGKPDCAKLGNVTVKWERPTAQLLEFVWGDQDGEIILKVGPIVLVYPSVPRMPELKVNLWPARVRGTYSRMNFS